MFVKVLLRSVFCASLLWPYLVSASDPIMCIDEGQYQRPPVAPAPVALQTALSRPVYAGAVPPGADPGLPVLVLVHGLHGSAEGWYGETEYYGRNDMYDAAYAAGFRTYLVDLDQANGNASTSIDNGRLLRDQIAEIRQHAGVNRVNVLAHSKGSPDANIAAIFGAPIDAVVSLSGANWGSPLADLAQTSWLDWLAELIGFNDAGTKFMQTGCMSLVRGFLDSRPRNDSLFYYTAAGTGWGPLLSALEFGGLYLYGACPGTGDNDGVVCVDHANHPLSRDAQGVVNGEHRVVWDLGGPDFELDHDNIRMGSAFLDFFWWFSPDDCYVPVFDSVAPYLGGAAAAGSASVQVARAAPRERRPAGSILRGGAITDAGAETTFPVESGVAGLQLRVLGSHAGMTGRLIAPDGSVHDLPAARPAGSEVFRGAFVTGIDLGAAEKGEWRLQFAGQERAAYAAHIVLDSKLRAGVSTPAGLQARAGDAWSLQVDAAARDVRLSVETRRTSTALTARSLGTRTFKGAGAHQLNFTNPGVYNLALTLQGTDKTGAAFERSQVLSVAVPDTARVAAVPSACE